MSKKNKNKQTQKETPADLEIAPAIQTEETGVQEKAVEPVLIISDAALRYIVGYKTHWLSALKTSAKNAGIDPESSQAESVWKSIFQTWGAKLK